REARLPIAAPSANPFTRVSPTTAEHVRQGLGPAVDLVLDGGPTPVGIESTVVDLTASRPALLRPGTISRAELEAGVGPLASAPPGTAVPGEEEARRSPGMVRRHYSPRAELRVFGEGEREAMAEVARRASAEGRAVGGVLLR